MTRRSSHPCREWEGPSSPRCSQDLGCPAATRLRRLAQSGRSRACHQAVGKELHRRPTTGLPAKASLTPSTTGRVSPFSTIRAAEPNTLNSEAEVIAMAGRCDRSPTASSTSPAPCLPQIRRRLQPVLSRSKTRLINGGESHQASQCSRRCMVRASLILKASEQCYSKSLLLPVGGVGRKNASRTCRSDPH